MVGFGLLKPTITIEEGIFTYAPGPYPPHSVPHEVTTHTAVGSVTVTQWDFYNIHGVGQDPRVLMYAFATPIQIRNQPSDLSMLTHTAAPSVDIAVATPEATSATNSLSAAGRNLAQPTISPPESSASSSSLSMGAKAAVAVGLSLVSAFLAILALVVLRKHRRQRMRAAGASELGGTHAEEEEDAPKNTPIVTHELQSSLPAQLLGAQELDVTHTPRHSISLTNGPKPSELAINAGPPKTEASELAKKATKPNSETNTKTRHAINGQSEAAFPPYSSPPSRSMTLPWVSG